MLPNGPFSISPAPLVANGSIATISPSSRESELIPPALGMDLPACNR